MLISIKGKYTNGAIVLDEKPNVDEADVIVTLLETPKRKQNERIAGTLKGKIVIPDNFNTPLDEFKDYQ